jgi:toxin ParE1/3/4
MMGRERPDIGRGIRSFAIISWMIFDRVERDFLEIVRVLHGARDLDEIDF